MASKSTDLGFVDGLVQLSFAVQTVLTKAAARHDLTVPQVRLLGILRDREPGMMQLAAHLGLDKSSVTGLIDRAEKRGLVQRVSSPDDGRAVRVATTHLGKATIANAEAEIVTEIQSLAAVLSAAEQRSLSKLTSNIVGALDSAGALKL